MLTRALTLMHRCSLHINLFAWTVLGVAFAVVTPSTRAATLPDHRAYELVTRYSRDGTKVGLNSVERYFICGSEWWR